MASAESLLKYEFSDITLDNKWFAKNWMNVNDSSHIHDCMFAVTKFHFLFRIVKMLGCSKSVNRKKGMAQEF